MTKIHDISARIKAKLSQSGIPAKEIKVLGTNIIITAWSEDAAKRWASLLANFSTIRGIVKSIDDNVSNKPGQCVGRKYHDVWRTFAVIE